MPCLEFNPANDIRTRPNNGDFYVQTGKTISPYYETMLSSLRCENAVIRSNAKTIL